MFVGGFIRRVRYFVFFYDGNVGSVVVDIYYIGVV